MKIILKKIAASGFLIFALGACVSGGAMVTSSDADTSNAHRQLQLPKSYPCQNLHVKVNCPPR